MSVDIEFRLDIQVNELKKTPLQNLTKRLNLKYDYIEKPIGHKNIRNWISGEIFFEHNKK